MTEFDTPSYSEPNGPLGWKAAASARYLGRLRVTGRISGVEMESEFAQHVVMRDGLIVSSRDYLSHAEALEAAGLS